MDRLKFRCVTDAGIYHAPSDSFSVSFHDTGISLIFWSSDGIVDEIDVDSVYQFTGLQDNTGKDIYEGDIVKTKARFGTSGKHPKKTGEYIETVAKVVFTSEGEFTYVEPEWQHKKRIDLGNSTDWYRCYCSLKDCEIIGNIHENPELIEA